MEKRGKLWRKRKGWLRFKTRMVRFAGYGRFIRDTDGRLVTNPSWLNLQSTRAVLYTRPLEHRAVAIYAKAKDTTAANSRKQAGSRSKSHLINAFTPQWYNAIGVFHSILTRHKIIGTIGELQRAYSSWNLLFHSSRK